MAGFVNNVLFNPTLGGTTDWVVSSAVTGYNTPAGAGALNGMLYKYRAESADLSQWEIGEGAYTVGSTTLARTTVLLNSAGTTAKINFSTVPQVGIVALGEDLRLLANGATTAMVNGQIVESHAANAMTFTLQTLAGATPSTIDPVWFFFKTQTGTISVVSVTSALTIVIPSGTTIGTFAALNSPIYIYAVNNAGTVVLGVSLRYHGEAGVVTTVAISGGSSSTTMYSTAAQTTKDFVCIGVAYSTQTTAGTWTASPTLIQLCPLALKSYHFRVSLSSNQAVSATTFSKIQLATEYSDPDACFDNVTNFRFTCREPGRYLINSAAATNSGGPGGVYIRLNGSTIASSASSSTLGGVGPSVVLELVPGDYIELFFYTSGADSVYGIPAYTYLSGVIVR